MIIVGSGAIGVEFAYFYNSMGTEVTIVEFLPNIVPLEDEEVSKQFERSLKKSKIKVMTNSSVTKVDTSGKGVVATVQLKKEKLPWRPTLFFRLLVSNQILKTLVLKMLEL